jgi:RNA polymerase sigma factor (sigma-70 family)
VAGPGQREFEHLWADHHHRVHAYALRRTDPASAQDVVSETFLTAWRRRDELPDDALPWLLGVARLMLANHARSLRRREALVQLSIEQAVGMWADPAEADHEILHALAALTPGDREALLLVGWDGLRPAEAARVLGCTPATFRVRAFRARRRLVAQLEDARLVNSRLTIETETQ